MSVLLWFEIRVVPHSYSSMGGREGRGGRRVYVRNRERSRV